METNNKNKRGRPKRSVDEQGNLIDPVARADGLTIRNGVYGYVKPCRNCGKERFVDKHTWSYGQGRFCKICWRKKLPKHSIWEGFND